MGGGNSGPMLKKNLRSEIMLVTHTDQQIAVVFSQGCVSTEACILFSPAAGAGSHAHKTVFMLQLVTGPGYFTNKVLPRQLDD